MKRYLICFLSMCFLCGGTVLSEDADKSAMLGIRTVIYEVNDLKKAIDWYSEAFTIKPYVNTPEYVGFNIRGYELGLMPEGEAPLKGNNVLSYWGVDDVDSEYTRLMKMGAKSNTPIIAVGGGIRLGTLVDPFGNVLGLIYNPIFKIEE